ncbi:DUF1003 domain-containing protein [Actinomyces radicidentis]|uniref:DUF1003 domain-containing protein n=1 Tax=Actinomyces radicidentis TaxID=111015 RepID=UPI0028E6D11D|nr:DUF1003 domain-containing protein [Actinomyces radicidentis]
MPDSSLDQPLAKGRARWMRWTSPNRGSSSKSDTSGRVAEAIARFSGTPTFLIWLTLFVAGWMAWNTFGPTSLRFDKASLGFTALTLVLSLQASYSAPLILLAQNRQDDRDRVTAEQDRQRAESNLQDTEFLTREIASLRLAMNDVATRDFVRSELRDVMEEILAEERRSREEIVGEIVEELADEDDDDPRRDAVGAAPDPGEASDRA